MAARANTGARLSSPRDMASTARTTPPTSCPARRARPARCQSDRVHTREELDRDLAWQPFVHDGQCNLLAACQQSRQHVQGVLGRGGDATVVRPESSIQVRDEGGTDVILVADNQYTPVGLESSYLHSDPSWWVSLSIRASCVICLGGSSDRNGRSTAPNRCIRGDRTSETRQGGGWRGASANVTAGARFDSSTLRLLRGRFSRGRALRRGHWSGGAHGATIHGGRDGPQQNCGGDGGHRPPGEVPSLST